MGEREYNIKFISLFSENKNNKVCIFRRFANFN
jgi:hypothetical protein